MTEHSTLAFSQAFSDARELEFDGRWDEAAALLHEVCATAAAESPRYEARALVNLLRLRNFQDFIQHSDHGGEKAEVLARLEALGDDLADPRLLADALHERAVDLHFRYFVGEGNLMTEREMLEEALALRRSVGDEAGVGWSLVYIGTIDQIEIDHGAGLPMFEEALAIATQLVDPVLASYATRHIGYVRQYRKEWAAAEEAFAKSLAQREKAGWLAGTASALQALGGMMLAHREFERARVLLLRAREIGEEIAAGKILDSVERDLTRCSA